MAVAKIYNSQTGQWEAVIVGTTGDTGVVQSDTEPSNTDQLWLDTDDTAEPLAIPAGGSAGQILQKSTDGDYDTAWSNVPSHNYIINGAFDIWQRGDSTAHSITSIYSADRWGAYRDAYAAGLTTSKQPAGLDDFEYCMRVQRDSGNTLADSIILAQPLESIESKRLIGKTVTLSFYARAGADLSSTVLFRLRTSEGTDQTPWVGLTNGATTAQGDFALTTSWEKYSISGTVPTTANQIMIQINYGPTGTAGANDYFEITGVQLEAGSVATPFKRNANSIAGELAACKRYYQVIASGNTEAIAMGHYYDSTTFNAVMHYTEMRSTPSLEETTPDGTTYYVIRRGNGANGLTSLNRIIQTGTTAATINAGSASGASGTQGIGGNLYTNDADSFVALNAEL